MHRELEFKGENNESEKTRGAKRQQPEKVKHCVSEARVELGGGFPQTRAREGGPLGYLDSHLAWTGSRRLLGITNCCFFQPGVCEVEAGSWKCLEQLLREIEFSNFPFSAVGGGSRYRIPAAGGEQPSFWLFIYCGKNERKGSLLNGY